SLFDISIDLFHSHEVTHGIDHSPNLGAIVLHHDVVGPLETERTQRVTLALTATDGGLVLSNFELCHQDFAPLSAAARSNACGATSSTGRPRRAATSSGRSRFLSAVIAACTMLIAFDEPSDFDSTSWTPAASRTARTGPPAMTPVPGAAGRSRTTPAASSPGPGAGWSSGCVARGRSSSSLPRHPWRWRQELPPPCRIPCRPCRRRLRPRREPRRRNDVRP